MTLLTVNEFLDLRRPDMAINSAIGLLLLGSTSSSAVRLGLGPFASRVVRLGVGPYASASAPSQRVDVLIAGGGPAGLAAATSLAAAGLAVTVVERRPNAASFETQRAYLYLLDRRGQQWTDLYNQTAAVRDRGVSNDGYTITRAYPDKRGAVTSVPELAVESTRAAIWVPRTTLLDILSNAAAEAGADLRFGVTLESFERGSAVRVGGAVEDGICAVLGDGTRLAPRLVLGCDGLDSRVRATLREWAVADGGFPALFDPVKLPSPSSGLQYKMLLVPSNFSVLNLSTSLVQPTPIQTESASAYTVPSVTMARNERLRLGLLPSRDASVPRTANVIKPASHAIWQLRTPEALLDFLGRSFPQMEDIRELVSPEEAAAFVGSRAGRFPAPQYVRRVAASVGGTGFVLLGDAAHAFPPDLGQGVNSALEDVVVLIQTLQSSGALPISAGAATRGQGAAGAASVDGGGLGLADDEALARALDKYQAERAPAAKALAHIVQVRSTRVASASLAARHPNSCGRAANLCRRSRHRAPDARSGPCAPG